MNDDGTNIDPVEMTELSPTRAELIARVRARGRQIRARRRLAVTGLTALVVLAIAAPAIAIGARSSSHGVTPATVAHRKGDFRVAVVVNSSSPPCAPGTLPFNRPVAPTQHTASVCLKVGAEIMSAADVHGASVYYDDTLGWTVNVKVSRAAVDRLAAHVNRQAAIIVNDRVVSAPVVNPGITGTTVTISPLATRQQAIKLATEILGRAPAHVDAAQLTLSTSVELPGTTFAAGTDVSATLVIDNETASAMTLETGPCRAKWALSLTNPSVPLSVLFPTDCAVAHTMLEPGANRFPVTITTKYTTCSSAGTISAANEVPCLSDGSIPPLPPGDYHVVLTTDPQGVLPALPTVTVHVTAGPPAPSAGALTLQTGTRSIKLLVPAGWKFTGQDAGGSGSGSTWTNPRDPNEKIDAGTGVEVGSWWQTDGVAGSIHLPAGFLPAGAHIQRANNTTFLYQYTAANGNVVDGVWIAELDHGQPSDFVSAEVQLPAALHSTATTIINRFISDRNALRPNP